MTGLIVFDVIQYVVKIVVYVDYKILLVKEAFDAGRMVLIAEKADYSMMVRVAFADGMIVLVVDILVAVVVCVRNNSDLVFLIVLHRKHHL